MAKLIAQGREHEAAEVWRRAINLADGDTPSDNHVRRALAEYDKVMGYTPARRVVRVAGSCVRVDEGASE
jgi:hypothetical protein